MQSHKRCPECDSPDTEVVHTEWYEDHCERVRICHDCPAQFTVSYGMPTVEEVVPDAA